MNDQFVTMNNQVGDKNLEQNVGDVVAPDLKSTLESISPG